MSLCVQNAKTKLESAAYSRPVFVGGMCYGKINEISSNLDRIESNTCEKYMLYMMEHVRKNSFPLDIFRAAVSWYFQPTKKLV